MESYKVYKVKEVVDPKVKGFITDDRLRLIEVPTVVPGFLKVTIDVETVHGDGEHPPTFPWYAVGRATMIAELDVSGCASVNVSEYVVETPI